MKKYPVYPIRRFNCNSVNSDLYINTFKNHLINHSFVEEPYRHNSYVLFFLLKVQVLMKSILPYFNSMIEEIQGNQIMKQDKIMNLLDIIHIEIARKYSETHLHKAHSYNMKIKNFELL